jgi:hypothetical protein
MSRFTPHRHYCRPCGRSETITYRDSDLSLWRKGMVIQQAFSYLTPDQREMIKTGICAECWESMTGGEE